MPTKTSYSSPLTYGTTLGSPEELASILGDAASSAGTSAAAGKAIGTASKLAGKINPITGVLMAAQLGGAGFMEGKESLDALKQADPSASKGQRVGAALGGFGLGVANQLLGTDFQFKNKAIRDHEAKIDSFMAEKSSLTMKKPLTQMQGTIAHNMSAKQYNENKKMNALAMHGIPAALTLKGDQYKIDANKDGEITGEDFEILKNK